MKLYDKDGEVAWEGEPVDAREILANPKCGLKPSKEDAGKVENKDKKPK